MYLDSYKIEGTLNHDNHQCYNDPNTFPQFQEGLERFKTHIKQLVDSNSSATFYKFGDGDYRFLNQIPEGSAKPGQRALSLPYDKIDIEAHRKGAQLCDFYTCELYPENQRWFSEVINRDINYPAEYGYGLVANKWFTKTFDSIGLIGAGPKMVITEALMCYQEYKDYLGLDYFTDYIQFPQKFAADDLDKLERIMKPRIEGSKSKLFLVGIGHAKSGILHKFKEWTDAVFLDVGGGIDMLAGCINTRRPFAGEWKNFRHPQFNYDTIDYMNYNHGNEKMVKGL